MKLSNWSSHKYCSFFKEMLKQYVSGSENDEAIDDYSDFCVADTSFMLEFAHNYRASSLAFDFLITLRRNLKQFL